MAGRTFELVWTEAGLGEAPADRTIKPPAADRSLHTLPELSIALPGGPEPTELALEGPIGEGGMGVVWAARQASLDRVVAVKRPRPDAPDAVHRALVAEARILGALDHPNIVPVHVLGVDPDGAPALIMKRVEGAPWSALLREPPAWFLAGEDALRRHVEVAIAVCRALEFAHARGVVHRDVKPDNVMVGRFGEVYLMDWGIARRLDGAPRRHVVGTPAYLAPELLDLTMALGPWTDVYAAGACLHEVLTGHPPHRGGSLADVLRSVHAAEPPALGDGALQAVVKQALAREPADRWPDAGALRLALEGALRQRDAGRLADVGRALAAELATAPDDRVDELFTEARFAFRQALAADPAGDARASLHQLLTAHAASLAARGDVASAEALLRELAAAGGDPGPVRAQVDAARVEREAAAALQRDQDLRVSAGLRAALLAQMVVLFAALAVLVLSRPDVYDEGFGLVLMFGSYAAAFVAAGVFWRPLTATAAGRSLLGVLGWVAGVGLFNRFAAWWWDTGVAPMLAVDLVILAAGVVAVAQVLGRRMAWATAPLVLGAAWIAARPDQALAGFVVGSLLGGSVLTALSVQSWRARG